MSEAIHVGGTAPAPWNAGKLMDRLESVLVHDAVRLDNSKVGFALNRFARAIQDNYSGLVIHTGQRLEVGRQLNHTRRDFAGLPGSLSANASKGL